MVDGISLFEEENLVTSPRPLTPDALAVAMALLVELIVRTVPRRTAEELFLELLRNNPAAERLSEQERLEVLRLCHRILDGAYRVSGDPQ